MNKMTPEHMTPEQEYQAIVAATRAYVERAGFTDVVVGLSGGFDSALTAAIAVDAFDSGHVHGVLMPSPHTSRESIVDAWELADLLGIETQIIPISSSFEILKGEIEAATETAVTGLAYENIQARLRGVILMALSNMNDWLVLATGNKSEVYAGFSTLYGDTVGGFAPLSATYKTRAYELARWRNEQGSAIPISSLEKEPSAELRDEQLDTDTLPPYLVLDGILARYVDEGQTAAEIIAAGFDQAVVESVIARVTGSAYKRDQMPSGPTFGTDAPATSTSGEGIA